MRLIGLALLVIALSACGQRGAVEPASVKGGAVGAWIATHVAGERLPGYKPTLDIATTGQYRGVSWCNDYFGAVKPGADQSLSLGPIGATRKACYALREEGDYFAALRAVTSYRLGRFDLWLLNAAGQPVVKLVRAEKDQLVGRSWQLAAIRRFDAVEPQAASTAPRIRFTDKSIDGHNGCVAFTGSADRVGRGVLIKDLATSQAGCRAEVAAQANLFMGHLESARFVALSVTGRLGLFGANGEPLLEFTEVQL